MMNAPTAFYPATRLNDRLAALSPRSSNAFQLTAVLHHERAVLLGVAGDIDDDGILTWERALDEAIAAVDPPGSLLIDLRGVGALGSAAVAALGALSLRCREGGVKLGLISSTSRVTHTIATGVWSRELPIYDNVDDAVRGIVLAPTESDPVRDCGYGR